MIAERLRLLMKQLVGGGHNVVDTSPACVGVVGRPGMETVLRDLSRRQVVAHLVKFDQVSRNDAQKR